MSRGSSMLLRSLPTDKGMEFSFGGVSDAAIANLIAQFFISRGFTLGLGSPIAGIYETGSAAGRAVLGGFVKRQKYSVNIWTDSTATHALVQSEMSGASGSVVGVVRERRGRDEIKSALQWHVQSAFGGSVASASMPHQPQMANPPTSVGNVSVELARLSGLLREGLFTQQEFDAAKWQLLGS
jgi:hypothetical protein